MELPMFNFLNRAQVSAIDTRIPVHANRLAVFRASPFFRFQFYKPFHTKVTDTFQVGNHAHAVFRAIPFVQFPQTETGESVTLKAISGIHSLDHFTRFDSTGDAVVWFRAVLSATSRAWFFFSEISDTECTIHSARGDRGRGDVDGWGGDHLILTETVRNPVHSDTIV